MSSTSTGITWSDLKSKIAASSLLKEWLGESVANVYSNSDSPVVMAQKIFVKLLSTFDVASYFTDENVISQMSFYSDFAKKYSLTMDNIYKYFSVKGSEELLNKLCCQKYLTDLDTLLDNISMDYFGYVLKNPSQNSGYWPSGTYFAGWIQVKATGGTIVDDLTTNGAQQVFTLDYATWVSAGMSIKAVNSDLSSATVKHNEDGKNYEYKITQFLAKVKGQKVDDQSNRVDKDVYVFAAYNAQVFDINLTNDTMNMTIKLGDVMSDGTVYEYTTDDIVIVKLTETQRDKYLELIANGAARPTALREVLGNQAGWAYANRSTAISNLKNSGGGYLVAFVYKKTYGTGGKIVNDSNNIIYEVSDTWISYDGIALKVIDEQTGE
jgi:hypothetical protein